MKRIAVFAAIVLCTTAIGSAQVREIIGPQLSPRSGSSKTTLVGFLVDTACIAGHRNALYSVAYKHRTDCALEASSKGLGVVSGNKWYPFDEKGSKKAAELLEHAKTRTGLMVSVTGKLKDDGFSVSSIKEIETND